MKKRKTSVARRRAFGLHEIARDYGVSLGFLRNEIERGNLLAMRFGRRIVIEAEEWEAYLGRARAGGLEMLK